MSAAFAPVGAGLMLGGKLFQGSAARAAANRNAALAEYEADAIMRDSVAEQARLRDEQRRQAGEAIAAMGASGVQLGTGSPLDVLRDNALNAELDLLTLRQNARAAQQAKLREAQNSRASGRTAMVEALFGAGVDVFKAADAGAFAPRVRR